MKMLPAKFLGLMMSIGFFYGGHTVCAIARYNQEKASIVDNLTNCPSGARTVIYVSNSMIQGFDVTTSSSAASNQVCPQEGANIYVEKRKVAAVMKLSRSTKGLPSGSTVYTQIIGLSGLSEPIVFIQKRTINNIELTAVRALAASIGFVAAAGKRDQISYGIQGPGVHLMFDDRKEHTIHFKTSDRKTYAITCYTTNGDIYYDVSLR